MINFISFLKMAKCGIFEQNNPKQQQDNVRISVLEPVLSIVIFKVKNTFKLKPKSFKLD